VVHLELLLDAYDPPQDTGRRLTGEGAR
jgi:hypothetical protein